MATVTTMSYLSSAVPFLSLLAEPEDECKAFALNKLNDLVHSFWPEISENLMVVEQLSEDGTFPHRNIAALLASKIHFYLGSFDDALDYALKAETAFMTDSQTEYVQTMVTKCIDRYILIKSRLVGQEGEGRMDDVRQSDRLEELIKMMVEQALVKKQFKYVAGLAMESHNLDYLKLAIIRCPDKSDILLYCFRIGTTLIGNRGFRNKVLNVLVYFYSQLGQPDYLSQVQCYIFLDQPEKVADILNKLMLGSERDQLLAHQIAFDLYDSATQQFLSLVESRLTSSGRDSTVSPPPSSAEPSSAVSPPSDEPMDVDAGEAADSSPSSAVADKAPSVSLEPLKAILSGETTIGLYLQFLIRNNKADIQVLKSIKDTVRNSVCHTATVMANAFASLGTTSDQFLRDNLEWLARANNWSKFTATASLGLIHQRHEREALRLMETYLPKDSSSSSSYSEGGGLYALGLIHANHGAGITEYLIAQLGAASTEAVRHGGCLGLGLAAMGTGRGDVYQLLRSQLYQDDAVTGEAAGIAMGLVMVGSRDLSAISDMLNYMRDSEHEKIHRGLALGLSLLCYGVQDDADELIATLSRDKDPLIRRSAMFTIGMAYCGSGSNASARRLLHHAVSDVNDDVRRAACVAIGFVLCRHPDQCPNVVRLIAESYNPHMRVGSAYALGIACAGTANKEALALLEPMFTDSVNYVRQGSLLAASFILVQHTEAMTSKAKDLRDVINKIINDKHEDVMAKFGAILSRGIIDASGKNATISLVSRTGHLNMPSVVGILVFTHFWYWFPAVHFLSLAFIPSCIIGLNKDLRMPKIGFRSNAKPSLYAYSAPIEEKKGKEKEKVATAILSITNKKKKKEKDDAADESVKDVDMEVVEETTDETTTKPKPEASFSLLSNPCRALPSQLKVVVAEGSRYSPMKPLSNGGIIMLSDGEPNAEPEMVEDVAPAAGGGGAEGGATAGEGGAEEVEPEPPLPFEWRE